MLKPIKSRADHIKRTSTEGKYEAPYGELRFLHSIETQLNTNVEAGKDNVRMGQVNRSDD
jgi:hypothetical protein